MREKEEKKSLGISDRWAASDDVGIENAVN
jgi:hypothetical protein